MLSMLFFVFFEKFKLKFLNKLQIIIQVPAGAAKKELLDQLDKVPTYVQTLQFTVKDPTVGKAATFVKVDHVIQETKNLMNIISKVVSTCFDCANKVSIYIIVLNISPKLFSTSLQTLSFSLSLPFLCPSMDLNSVSFFVTR